jgi:2-phospho-L-lactate/phosphoenolpyruvate guanylyltransferase
MVPRPAVNGIASAYRAYDARVERVVLIPVKAFAEAKVRLSGHLSTGTRRALARSSASRVVASSAPLPVFVVCDDDEVAAWTRGVGAEVIWTPGVGLNAAVRDGVATLFDKGADDVVIAHSDLALPQALPTVHSGGGCTLVPDHRRDGTNVLAVHRSARSFQFSYGVGSFRRHLANACHIGAPVHVVVHAELSLDIDTVDDLVHPRVAPVAGLSHAGVAP